MPAAEYFIRLQNGITGGFAPPTPNSIFNIAKTASEANITVDALVRPAGTPELQAAAPKSISSADKHTNELLDELVGILKVIPTESPPGSEDIYGLDTSILYGSEGFEWCNGGPQGCGGGTSEVQATAEEKAKFKRAVDIVTELASKDK